MKRIILIISFLSSLLVLSDCNHPNFPEIQWKCEKDSYSLKVLFPELFYGTIYARGYFAHPNCSSPNMSPIVSRKVELNLSFLLCGNKLRYTENEPQFQNNVVIQFHHMVQTENDLAIELTCAATEELSDKFWESHKKSIKPLDFVSWVDLQMGNVLFPDKIADMIGISDKLYVVVYVRGGNRKSYFRVRKCIAHDDEVILSNTTVVNLTEFNSCSGDFLNLFYLNANTSISDLKGFSEVKEYNITDLGELSILDKDEYYVTCGMEFCPTFCERTCPGQEPNRFAAVKTHKITKRLGDVLFEQEELAEKRKAPKIKNNYLKLAVLALSQRLSAVKRQSRIGELEREVSEDNVDPLRSDSLALKNKHKPSFRKIFHSSPEEISANSIPSARGRSLEINESNPDLFKNSEIEPYEINESETLALTTENDLFNFTTLADLGLEREIFVSPKSILVINQTESVGLRRIESEDTSSSFSTEEFMTAIKPISTTSSTQFANQTASDNRSLLNELPRVIDISVDVSHDNYNVPANEKSDCIPKLKFIFVTCSLCFIIVCFFGVCVGFYLSLRREKKRNAIDNYLLYSIF